MDATCARWLISLCIATAPMSMAYAGGFAFFPPDLRIAKSHVGNLSRGQAGATYTIVVSSAASVPPLIFFPTAGAVTVVDSLPPSLTATSIAGTGWSCALATLTCTRSDSLVPGASYPPIVLTVDVSVAAPAVVVNTATVSGGGEYPAFAFNNTVNDIAAIDPVPDLVIAKTHSGAFLPGQAGASYDIVVANAGRGATSGMVTVVDTFPTALSATAIAGGGWSCTLSTLTCTRSDPLVAGASYPPIALTFDIPVVAPSVVVNTATVAGDGEDPAYLYNNTASDRAAVGPSPDLAIAKTHSGTFLSRGEAASYDIVVRNVGPGFTSGTVTVVDTLPAGLGATAIAGSGWSCTLATLICTRADALGPGESYPPIVLTVNVSTTAPDSVINFATVSGGGDITPANGTASDVTAIAGSAVELSIPALNEWALLLLATLLAISAAAPIRRR